MSEIVDINLGATLPIGRSLRVRLFRTADHGTYTAALEIFSCMLSRDPLLIVAGYGETVDDAVGGMWLNFVVLQRDAARAMHALRMAAKDLGLAVADDIPTLPLDALIEDMKAKGER